MYECTLRNAVFFLHKSHPLASCVYFDVNIFGIAAILFLEKLQTHLIALELSLTNYRTPMANIQSGGYATSTK